MWYNPGYVCHISVMNHRISIMISTMTRVLIMALFRHFTVKFKVKFGIFYESYELQFCEYSAHYDFFWLYLDWTVWKIAISWGLKINRLAITKLNSPMLWLIDAVHSSNWCSSEFIFKLPLTAPSATVLI